MLDLFTSTFFLSLIDALPVTSPGIQEGNHTFTCYFLRPCHLPGTELGAEYSKMAEIVPALKSLPARAKSRRARTLSSSFEGPLFPHGHDLTDRGLASKDSQVPWPCTQR